MNKGKLFWAIILGLFLSGVGPGPAFADLDEIRAGEIKSTEASVAIGYRGVSKDKTTSRTLEYDSLESSPLFDLDLAVDRENYFLDLDFDYLNEKDYTGELRLNTKGLARVALRTERFFHNLDHIPYDNGYEGGENYPPFPGPVVRNSTGTAKEGSRADGVFTNTDSNDILRTYYTDHDPQDSYGLRLDINEAKFKIKHPTYPAHLNLSYWRYEKKGEKQLRFVGENCTTACHMQSRTRDIDRVTEQINVEVDTHVGMIDLAAEALFRTFRDNESTPNDTFGTHFRGRDIDSNPMQHSEDPESKLTEITFKANTAPSGGLVGSASFTIGERENQSELSSIAPIKATTDYYKTSTDITYTPNQYWTLNLRHRLLDMDSDNSDQLTAYGSTNSNNLDVREAMDIKRSWYEMIVNYRPSYRFTLKGELHREDIDRSNTGFDGEHHSNATDPIEINPDWQLPDEETILKGKIGFYSRLLEKSALKFSGWLALQKNDDPAYGASFGKSTKLFLSGSYNPTPFWGVLANFNWLDEENNKHELHEYSLDREKQQQNINIGSYVTPLDGLSFDINYGFFRTDIDQGVLFGTGTSFVPALGIPVNYAIFDESSDYRQTIHTVSLGMTWQALENLSCRIEGQHTSSKSRFSTNFGQEGPYPYNIFSPSPYYSEASSSGFSEINELDIRQNSLRGRITWKIDEHWSCMINATYDDYDDRNNNYDDGSVQTTMINFARAW